MPAIDQVIQIWAAGSGYMDELPVDKVQEYAAGLVEYFKTQGKAVRDELASSLALSDDLVKKIEDTLNQFKAG